MKQKFNSVRIHSTGGPEKLSFDTVDFDSVQNGGVLVKNDFAGVNFIDTYHRSGLYKVTLPFTLGVEGGGIVEYTTGDKYKRGDRVVYFGDYGSYSEYSLVPESEIIPVPDGLDSKIAVGSLLQGMTASFLSQFIFPLADKHTCLIHAAAGGVGLFLVQMARQAGSKVIATVSTAEKSRQVLEMGADHVINYKTMDFEEETLNATGGNGVDVVFDSVGKDTFEKSLNVLKKFGCMVTFGNSSGPVPSVSPLELKNKGSVYLVRPSLFHFKSKPEAYRLCWYNLFQRLSRGHLKLIISDEFELRAAASAHEALEARRTTGKVLLKI